MTFADLKYELIRTPLERPLLRLRRALRYLQRHRHPELREIYLEEGRIRLALERLVRPTSNCIDVGCHYGSMLSCFCRLAPLGRHVAFEVVPAKARFLRRKFPEVDVHELALSDRAGTASFFVHRKATGLSSLVQPRDGESDRIEVETARLDDVLPVARGYDLLKLDVEGAELPVLRGGRDTLARYRPVALFECGPGGPQAFGYEPGDLHDFLTKAGLEYAVFFLKDFLEGGGAVGREEFQEGSSRYPFRAFNWLAVPSERIAQDREAALRLAPAPGASPIARL